MPDPETTARGELACKLLEAARRILADDPDNPAARAIVQDLEQARTRAAAARVAVETIAPLLDAGKLEELYGERLGARAEDVRAEARARLTAAAKSGAQARTCTTGC